jgi:hypothetical protein
MSGTYQSRVFTFISKRTNRLKDTCAQGFRHIKVAVVWSSQILLYPIQLLAQKTKIFQPQLASPPQRRSLPQPVSDINIEQALELVVGAGYPIVIAERGSLTVTDARARNLPQSVSTGKRSMLVHEDSRTIENYDPDTEDWEVSSYSPRRSRQVMAKKPMIRGLSSLLIDRQLVLVTAGNEILDILTISQQQEIRRRIGIDLATAWYQWHTGKLPDSDTAQQLSANRQLPLAIVDRDRELQSTSLLNRWNNWLKSFNTKSPVTNSATAPESSFQPLTWENGTEIAKIEQRDTPQSLTNHYQFTPQPPQINRWLDLPQLPAIVEIQPIPSQTDPIQSTMLQISGYANANLQPDWLKKLWNYYRDYIYIPAENDDLIVDRPEAFQLIPMERESAQIELNRTLENQYLIDRTSPKTSDRIHQDWIEADSEIIGYSKSPIAKILAWLDRIILQIENWLIEIWHTVTNRRSHTKN